MVRSKTFIVVLGGGIDSQGNLPKHQYLRLDKAIETYSRTPSSKIILCGKYSFLYGEDKPVSTEAKEMYKYLIDKRIESKSIILEQYSKDTIGNAYYLKKYILKRNNYDKLILITSRFHLERVKFIFNKFFESSVLEFVVVKDIEKGEKEHEIIERQDYLLKKTKAYLHDMKKGDLGFLKNKIYKTRFYKEERPEWVKKYVAKGK